MKIQYTAASPKANQVEHVSQQVGQTLVAAGFAVPVPLPPRGSKGWLAAIQELDALRTKPHAEDVVPPGADGVLWSVTVQASQKVNVVKKVDGTIWFFDGPPADAPANIRQQFIELASINPAANAIALEAAKRAQMNYESKVEFAKRF